MTTYTSVVREAGRVQMPKFTGLMVYMLPFFKKLGLPTTLKDWQPVVDAMFEGVDTVDEMFLMIDQRPVKANEFHRRPGLHVDGYWDRGTLGHQGHGSRPPRHRSYPGSGSHVGGLDRGSWRTATLEQHEGLLLASNITACRAFNGTWSGPINDGGDCSHVSTAQMQEVLMAPDTVYQGNVAMLHESLPVEQDCLRTVVRINVPGWTPEVV